MGEGRIAGIRENPRFTNVGARVGGSWEVRTSSTIDGEGYAVHLMTAVITPKTTTPLTPDVVLQLADKDACCHSVILHARSLLFAGSSIWEIGRPSGGARMGG